MQYFNPAWLQQRAMQRRPEGKSDLVDALPQALCGCKSKFIAELPIFSETAKYFTQAATQEIYSNKWSLPSNNSPKSIAEEY